MCLEKKSLESISRELQKFNYVSKQLPNDSKTEQNTKRISANNIAFFKKEVPTSIQILNQLVMWALDNKYSYLNLTDVVLILNTLNNEKEVLANELFDSLHPNDIESIVKILLSNEAQRAYEQHDMNTFMRSNSLLTVIFKKQCQGITFSQDFLDTLPLEIKEFHKIYFKKTDTKESFEVKLIHNKYEILLRNFLHTLPLRLQDLPDDIKRNCCLISEELLSRKCEENIILNKIGGYLFLRFINPSLDNYVRSEQFRTKHISKKNKRFSFSKTKEEEEKDIFEFCTQAVKLAIIYPVQILSNFLTSLEISENNNDETSLDKKSKMLEKAGSTWKTQVVEIIKPYSDSVVKSIREILSKNYPQKVNKKQNYELKYYDATIKQYALAIINKYLKPSIPNSSLVDVNKAKESGSKAEQELKKDTDDVMSLSKSVMFLNPKKEEQLSQLTFEMSTNSFTKKTIL